MKVLISEYIKLNIYEHGVQHKNQRLEAEMSYTASILLYIKIS